MSRCTGKCCESFWLPLSPIEIQHQGKRAELGKCRWNIDDMKKIAEMVIYIRPDKHRGHIYTCKHFDKSTGNCGNYENRPTMCKDFPYGNACPFAGKGCTWVEAAECTRK